MIKLYFGQDKLRDFKQFMNQKDQQQLKVIKYKNWDKKLILIVISI